MTNPTPHGQVPEALRLAEEISNLVCSSEAAAKTIAAAADELCRLHVENASLRAQQPASPPAEQQATKETSGGFHVWRDISTAPKDGSRFVATGHNYGLYSEVRHTCVAQWFRGCWMEASDWNEASELAYLTHWMPLPSPPDDVAAPAEQQAEPGAVYAELPAPTASIGTDDAWHEAAMRDFADRTHALRIEQAAPKSAQGVGNSGFDHKTAADLLNNKTVSDEAVCKFVQASRWAHDEKAALSATLLAMHGVLTSREAEIALLKKALLEAEAAPQQEAQEPVAGLVRCDFDDECDFCGEPEGGSYTRLVHNAEDCTEAEFYICACCLHKAIDAHAKKAAPQPAPAPLSDDVVKDAARYRWLRDTSNADDPSHMIALHIREEQNDASLSGIDAAIDAALAAQGGKV